MKQFVLSTDFVNEQIAKFNPNTKCDQFHAGTCDENFFNQFTSSIQQMYKLYLMVHLVPFLMKYKKLKKKPAQELKKLMIGYVRSLLFAGLSTSIVRRAICFLTQVYGYHHYNAIPSGFVSGISLMFQTYGRQAEIALFCLAKAMEVAWSLLLRRGYVKNIKYGQVLLFGLAIGGIGYFYQHQKERIKPSYLSVISKLLGEI